VRKGRFGVEFVLCFLFLALITVSVSWLPIQAQSPSDTPRHVKVSCRPEYSELARHLNLSGTVKVEVLIGPDGKVKKAHVVGGHPVLGVDAEKAALKTEFEPAPHDSTQVLEFRFGTAN
jgi:TonB family protein